jgi:secondary thiamine-phosphate synthase enzyme
LLKKFSVRTAGRSQLINITGQVREAVRQSGVREGLATVYCPHTTAGITVNEGADPDVAGDFLRYLDNLCPWEHPLYRHGEGNTAAHLKASIIGIAQAIPVVDGDLALGVWQAVFFCEFDGPRERTFLVKIIEG